MKILNCFYLDAATNVTRPEYNTDPGHQVAGYHISSV